MSDKRRYRKAHPMASKIEPAKGELIVEFRTFDGQEMKYATVHMDEGCIYELLSLVDGYRTQMKKHHQDAFARFQALESKNS